MLAEEFKQRTEQATVRVTKRGGQGVLIGNYHTLERLGHHFVVTAAHCVGFDCEGGMALGDYYIEDIETKSGGLNVSPWAIDPVSDVAILGALDGQVFFDEAEQFELFSENTVPVPLRLDGFALNKPFDVYVFTHKNQWVKGTAQQCRPDASNLMVQFDEQIEGGTSGGPVINEEGELVGVISTAGSLVASDGVTPLMKECSGSIPRPYLTMPVWVARFFNAQTPDERAMPIRIKIEKREESPIQQVTVARVQTEKRPNQPAIVVINRK